jgi:hypothetical protein
VYRRIASSEPTGEPYRSVRTPRSALQMVSSIPNSSTNDADKMRTMTRIEMLCKVFGHREYSEEVLTVRPWLDPEFEGYSRSDFRELNCLRCGEPLAREQSAAAAERAHAA